MGFVRPRRVSDTQPRDALANGTSTPGIEDEIVPSTATRQAGLTTALLALAMLGLLGIVAVLHPLFLLAPRSLDHAKPQRGSGCLSSVPQPRRFSKTQFSTGADTRSR